MYLSHSHNVTVLQLVRLLPCKLISMLAAHS
jgi:hypothetical protein